MSLAEYWNSNRHNQRIVRDFIEYYSENALMLIGVPRSGVKFMSTAAGSAAGQDARFYLTDSRVMTLDLQRFQQR